MAASAETRMKRPGSTDIQGCCQEQVRRLPQNATPIRSRWLNAQAKEAERRLDCRVVGKAIIYWSSTTGTTL